MLSKREIFTAEYIKNGCKDPAKAAIIAGYSAKTSYSQGCRLLKNVKVRAMIDKALKEQQERILIDKDRILLELYRIGTVDVRQAFTPEGKLKDIKDMPEDVARAISSVEVEELWAFNKETQEKERVGDLVKVKFWDKNKSLENLGRHFRMFVDKLEVKDTGSRADALLKARQRVIDESVKESKPKEDNKPQP